MQKLQTSLKYQWFIAASPLFDINEPSTGLLELTDLLEVCSKNKLIPLTETDSGNIELFKYGKFKTIMLTCYTQDKFYSTRNLISKKWDFTVTPRYLEENKIEHYKNVNNVQFCEQMSSFFKYIVTTRFYPRAHFPFPMDMLRYDRCFISNENVDDVIQSIINWKIPRGIHVDVSCFCEDTKHKWTTDRWYSFGWIPE